MMFKQLPRLMMKHPRLMMKHRLRIAIVAALVILVIGARHSVEMHREQVSRYALLQSVQKRTYTLGNKLSAAFVRYGDVAEEALKYGSRRHDLAVSGNYDIHDILTLLNRESADINSLRDLVDKESDLYGQVIDAFAKVEGADATRAASLDLRKYENLRSTELLDWSRSIDDMRDNVQMALNGESTSGTDHVEEYAHESEKIGPEADRLEMQIATDIGPLATQLGRAINDAEKASHHLF